MQIGPRIRVGGTLGKIGEKVKKPLLVGGALLATGGLAGIGPLAGLATKAGVLSKLATAGKFLKSNAKTIADYGALGEGVYDRVQENKVAGDAQARYRALQPLRDQYMQALQAPTPDVHSIFTEQPIQQGRYRKIGSGGMY